MSQSRGLERLVLLYEYTSTSTRKGRSKPLVQNASPTFTSILQYGIYRITGLQARYTSVARTHKFTNSQITGCPVQLYTVARGKRGCTQSTFAYLVVGQSQGELTMMCHRPPSAYVTLAQVEQMSQKVSENRSLPPPPVQQHTRFAPNLLDHPSTTKLQIIVSRPPLRPGLRTRGLGCHCRSAFLAPRPQSTSAARARTTRGRRAVGCGGGGP